MSTEQITTTLRTRAADGVEFKPRLALAVSISVIALIMAFAAGGALALTPTDCPIAGSAFQAADGDQDGPEAASCPAPGTFDDWQNRASLSQPDPNANDSTFGGGNKETEPDNWVLTTQAGGVTPAKANLLGAWSSLDQTVGSDFVYMAFRRGTNTGNTYLTFELNQRNASWTNSTGAVIPCRIDDDLLISYEVASTGTPPNVDLVVYRWKSTTTELGGCGRTGTLTPITPGPLAQAAMNATTITNYLDAPIHGSSLIPGTFGEAGVDLSGLLPASLNTCGGFVNIQMHSRSSTAINSQLQDFVSPQTINGAACPIVPPIPPVTPIEETPVASEPPPAPVGDVIAVGTPDIASARIASRSGCQRRAFSVRVSGKSITSVEFRVDNRRVRTLTRPDKRGRYVYKLDPRKFDPGSHRVTARVTFSPTTGTTARTLRSTFRRCAAVSRRVSPRFTG